jgi:tRNA-uridine aminocarboxypropyltransferase
VDPEYRAVCLRCNRPESVCWCAHVPAIATRTRVVILQHPRERYVAIGTGRMTAMCLTSASLHLGVEFENDAAVRAALADPTQPAALLWPGEGAIDIAASPPTGPITLVVIDGTWSTAKKLVRLNPFLASLPRYAFAPAAPSAYRIRREPRDDYVSTIEAVAHVLTVLEGDNFQPMLAPFTAMVDGQLEYQSRLRGARVRHRRNKIHLPRTRLAAELGGDHLVCVMGEANAWPYRDGETSPPDELVQWSARRLSTGEMFSAVIAPRQRLAPSTTSHTALSEERLRAGETFASFDARWREFIREDDVVCAWGHYARRLLLDDGGYLPEGYVDLRRALGDNLRMKAGSIDDVGERIGLVASPSMGEGRGGERLARVVDVAMHLAAIQRRYDVEMAAALRSGAASAAAP